MKGTVYIPDDIDVLGAEIADTLEEYSFNIEIKNDIDRIIYVDNFSNKHLIDPACGGLECEDKVLEETVVLLKKIICLGAIDKKMQTQEFKKNKSIFSKAFIYLQLKYDGVKIVNLDKTADFKKRKNLKTFPSKASKDKVINTLYDMLKTKNVEKDLKEIEIQVLKKEDDVEKFEFIEISDFILTDKFPEELKISKEQKERFEELLANSLSLNEREKVRVLEELGTLSMFQIKSLMEVFTEEQSKFLTLRKKNKKEIEKKQKEAISTWEYIKENINTFISIRSTKMLHEVLSKYVIGQQTALKTISTLFFHHKKMCSDRFKDINLGPVMLTGPTGSGKSFMIEKTSQLLNLDCIHVDCSVMVSEGIVGQGVQDIFKLLLQTCEYEIKRAQYAIIFLDEFDKLLTNLHSDSIFPQFLRAIEGARINITKSYNEHQEFKNIDFIDTHKMLFVLGGSFEHILKEKRAVKSGFIGHSSGEELKKEDILSSFPRELSGRIKNIISLNSLTEDDFYNILTKSKKSPLKTYKKVFSKLYHTNISFSATTLKAISKQASQSPYGARILDTLVSDMCNEKLFDMKRGEYGKIEF